MGQQPSLAWEVYYPLLVWCYIAFILDDGSGAVTIGDKLFNEAGDFVQIGSNYRITGPIDYHFELFKVFPMELNFSSKRSKSYSIPISPQH